MRALSTAELLLVWERSQGLSLAQKALALLAVACEDTSQEQLGRWSIGQRDGHLLSLRERLFGSRLQSLAECPGCGEKLELEFNVSDIRDNRVKEDGEELRLSISGYEVRFRPPNSQDLLGLSPNNALSANQLKLLEGCVLSVRHNEVEIKPQGLPAEAISAISNRLREADPQADIQLSLTCPTCCHHWSAMLDVVSFFWSEIHAWALRVMREVHALALAYGWSEAESLALSPWRRQVYLQMVGA